MANKVIIVSPDERLSRELLEALRTAEVESSPTILSEYPSREELRNLISTREGSIAAVIVDVGDPNRSLELIREVRESFPMAVPIAADITSRADSILGAMRAGAAEYLSPPFDPNQLREIFRERAKRESAKKPKGRVLCFMPAQGGNGASTVALHVADAVSREIKKKVLIIDFDFHSGTVAFRLRLKPDFTFADAVSRTEIIDELWPRIVCSWNGLDVLASPSSSNEVPADRLTQLGDVFESASRVYSCVVIDLPNALFTSCQDVLRLADAVYLVSTAEVMSLHLARRRINQLMQLNIPSEQIKLVVNRVGSKRGLETSDISKVVGVPVEWTLSNNYAVVSESYLKGGLVPQNSTLGKELTDFARHIMGIQATKPRGKRWKFI